MVLNIELNSNLYIRVCSLMEGTLTHEKESLLIVSESDSVNVRRCCSGGMGMRFRGIASFIDGELFGEDEPMVK